MAALEMGNGHDRQMLRRACAERWPLPLKMRRRLMADLWRAFRKADTVRQKNSCAKTIISLDKLNLEYAGHQRLEDGLPTDIQHLVFTFDSPPGDDPPAEALPEAEGGRLCP